MQSVSRPTANPKRRRPSWRQRFRSAGMATSGHYHGSSKGNSFKMTHLVPSPFTLHWLGDSMSDLKFVCWKEIFLKSLDETDPAKLARLVPAAELAIFKRQQELCDNPHNSEERSMMCIASEALRVVKHRITKPVVLPSSTGNPARFANFVRRSRTA
jgi:hypothetical protein